MSDGTLKPGWTRVRFGDVVRLNTDRCADPAAQGIERYVGIEHIEPEDLHIRRWGLVADGTTFTNRFRPGHVLFVKRRAYQRKVAVAEFEGVCSGDIYVFEPAGGRLLPELLPFLCQTEAFFTHALSTSAGSLSPRTNWQQLAQYQFALPPLEEQRRIAEVLSYSRRAMESAEQACEAGAGLVASFVRDQLGRHQATYSVYAVPALTDRLTVGIVEKPASWYVADGKGVPALRSLNVLPGHLQMSDLVWISEEGHRAHSKSQLSAGDIVIVRTGRPGDAAVIPSGVGLLNCIDLVVVTPKAAVLPEYLESYLNSPFGRRAFAAGTAGTAQVHFNVSAFSRLLMPCPPLSVQASFVEGLRALRQGKECAEERSRSGAALFAGLLNDLIGA